MQRNFDPIAYIQQVGQELVAAFQTAGLATTPGLVGSARETPVRNKLQQLLPRGMGVGSGCVVDSFGNTSRQMDVVLFEQDICPVYSINDDPQTTYYPCEGVIAVGEIKTAANSDTLEDIFRKIASVKKLRRFAQPSSPEHATGMDDYVAFRRYGSLITAATPKPGDYNQDTHTSDQIHGFALAGRLDVSQETLCKGFVRMATETGHALSPNLMVSLDGTVVCPISIPADRHNPTIIQSLRDANAIYCVGKPNQSFPFLLARLQTMYATGRTVNPAAFNRYIATDGIETLPNGGTSLWLPAD